MDLFHSHPPHSVHRYVYRVIPTPRLGFSSMTPPHLGQNSISSLIIPCSSRFLQMAHVRLSGKISNRSGGIGWPHISHLLPIPQASSSNSSASRTTSPWCAQSEHVNDEAKLFRSSTMTSHSGSLSRRNIPFAANRCAISPAEDNDVSPQRGQPSSTSRGELVISLSARFCRLHLG